MINLPESDFETLRQAAIEIVRGWSSAKAAMALRATGLDRVGSERASLEAIAADLAVSRETVRRARNELLSAIEPLAGTTRGGLYSLLSLHAPGEPSVDTPATARALRRLLTMTGPLSWDEIVSAWSRAGGKPPYSPLPADMASMQTWTRSAGGFSVTADVAAGRPMIIAVSLPEQLDQVGQFLLDTLRERPGGVDRREVLELAKAAGLKPTTVATALSMHPAVTRVARGVWALQGGGRREAFSKPPRISVPRRGGRVRPTTFTWDSDGSLLIEFSIPRGPSPVVAVPKAVSEIIEGREFRVKQGEKPGLLIVRNARLWGFGPLLSELKMPSGSRVTMALNLLASEATITPTEGKDTIQ